MRALALLACLIALPASAQDTAAARRAVATAIVNDSVAEQMTRQTFDAMLLDVRQRMQNRAVAEGKSINEAAWREYERAMMVMIGDLWQAQAPVLIDVFTDQLTLRELEVLRAFYADPEMVSAMEKLPLIMQAVMIRIGPEVGGLQRRLAESLPPNLIE